MTREHRRDEASAAGVRSALASHFERFSVGERLHHVPPHAVHAVTVDGTRAVCKLARGPTADPATEARVIEHVARETGVPVPEVLAVGEDHFVAAWLPGLPDSVAVDPDRARAMGAGLATLHAEAPMAASGTFAAGDDGLRLEGRGNWHATVRARLAGLADWLDDVGHGDFARAVLTVVQDHPDAFADAGDPVLCHGNYLPDHVGVDGGEVVAVIDFEHALAGPGEWDYWRAAIPLLDGHRAPDDPDARARLADAFRDGYESARSLPPGFDRRERLYRTVISVSYLRSLYVQNDRGPDVERRAERLRTHVSRSLDELAGDTP